MKEENVKREESFGHSDVELSELLCQLRESPEVNSLDVLSNYDVDQRLFTVKLKVNGFLEYFGCSQTGIFDALRMASMHALDSKKHFERESKIVSESFNLTQLVQLVEQETEMSINKLNFEFSFYFETRSWISQLCFNERVFSSESCQTKNESLRLLLIEFLIKQFEFTQV